MVKSTASDTRLPGFKFQLLYLLGNMYLTESFNNFVPQLPLYKVGIIMELYLIASLKTKIK